MDDLREKVISSLETLKQDFPKIISWQYDDQLQNTVGNMELAITLLKAQEPVSPKVNIDTYVCGACGARLERQSLIGPNAVLAETFNYCPNCGRKVQWE